MSSLSLARDAVRTAIKPESGDGEEGSDGPSIAEEYAARAEIDASCECRWSLDHCVCALEDRVLDAQRPWTTMSKPLDGYPDAHKDYSAAEWHEVPDTELYAHSAVVSAGWYSSVKRYRFINYGFGPLSGGPKLIIELELMGGTALRHIVNVNQIKGVITKHPSRQAFVPERIEEVIIDQRKPSGGYGFYPEQVKMKFTGPVNALAFQVALMAELVSM